MLGNQLPALGLSGATPSQWFRIHWYDQRLWKQAIARFLITHPAPATKTIVAPPDMLPKTANHILPKPRVAAAFFPFDP